MSNYNSIITCGTVEYNVVSNKYCYDMFIYGQQKGKGVQFITTTKLETAIGYDAIWDHAKALVSKYYQDESFKDGAYTCYFDHIINLPG